MKQESKKNLVFPATLDQAQKNTPQRRHSAPAVFVTRSYDVFQWGAYEPSPEQLENPDQLLELARAQQTSPSRWGQPRQPMRAPPTPSTWEAVDLSRQ